MLLRCHRHTVIRARHREADGNTVSEPVRCPALHCRRDERCGRAAAGAVRTHQGRCTGEFHKPCIGVYFRVCGRQLPVAANRTRAAATVRPCSCMQPISPSSSAAIRRLAVQHPLNRMHLLACASHCRPRRRPPPWTARSACTSPRRCGAASAGASRRRAGTRRWESGAWTAVFALCQCCASVTRCRKCGQAMQKGDTRRLDDAVVVLVSASLSSAATSVTREGRYAQAGIQTWAANRLWFG